MSLHKLSMNNSRFYELFGKKPVIGMIHLSCDSKLGMVGRALEELAIYGEEGVDGAIVENFHGDIMDVEETLKAIKGKNFRIKIGVNVLGYPYLGFEFAARYGGSFVQFDSVQSRDLNLARYNALREKYFNIIVLGGVRFKYTTQNTGNSLEVDLKEAMQRCDAIVTTGEGTGIETPIEKLHKFRTLLGDFPLIAGAGVDSSNVQEQIRIADGVIVGSYFKPNKDTTTVVNRYRVRNFMVNKGLH